MQHWECDSRAADVLLTCRICPLRLCHHADTIMLLYPSKEQLLTLFGASLYHFQSDLVVLRNTPSSVLLYAVQNSKATPSVEKHRSYCSLLGPSTSQTRRFTTSWYQSLEQSTTGGMSMLPSMYSLCTLIELRRALLYVRAISIHWTQRLSASWATPIRLNLILPKGSICRIILNSLHYCNAFSTHS